ncbi:MAG: hypothetical protein EFT35_07730 [Methanophagales archaeon ANME-1-THS]|nr:MAG: hypothetical protein EFT35_07730 [Methanophagales archaeon ANME-1-THS]
MEKKKYAEYRKITFKVPQTLFRELQAKHFFRLDIDAILSDCLEEFLKRLDTGEGNKNITEVCCEG